MAVNRTPVLKRCRSLGMDPIYLGIDKKSNRQSKRANRKMSEYGLQLREKQKAKFIYGVLEKPFRNYFAKASKMNGMTGDNLMILLESRLDNVVFRMGFARTRKEARQIVDHKHVLVNGKQVNIPSYLISAGDVIEIKEAKKAYKKDEVPIGAVIVKDNKIIARGHNRREERNNALSHAETEAINEACNVLGSWRLDGCTMYGTLEPCPMCAGALAWSQIDRVVYGAADPKRGYSRLQGQLFHPKTQIVGGVMAEECERLMTDFFAKLR